MRLNGNVVAGDRLERSFVRAYEAREWPITLPCNVKIQGAVCLVAVQIAIKLGLLYAPY